MMMMTIKRTTPRLCQLLPPLAAASAAVHDFFADFAGLLASVVVFFPRIHSKRLVAAYRLVGPFGLVGAVEGITYLAVIGIATNAIFYNTNNKATVQTKNNSQNFISSGIGIRRPLVVQGLAFLSIMMGLAVLAFQIIDS
jgi:hypothetical protein